jgi:DNA-binding GntR family transcriptional regulator
LNLVPLHTFERVRREPTRDLLCNAIRDAIFSGALKVGQRLPELRLTAQFQVSRAVVREALQQLAHEGLVDLNAHRGAQIVDMSPQQIDETIALRSLLEPEAVRLAMGRLTPDDAALVQDRAQRAEEARSDIQAFATLDFAFHETLWKLSGNSLLHRHLVLLTRPLFSLGIIMRRRSALAGFGAPGNHLLLAEKICSGDEEAALTAVREHITANSRQTRNAVDALHSLSEPAKPRQTRRPR